MKILMLNAYFQPEQIAFTHLEKDLLDVFVDEGFEIYVVTPVPTRGIDPETRDRYKTIKEEELYDGRVHVHRFWAPQEGKNPIIRAFRYFWCNLREYQIGKKYLDIDVIFAPSTPPTQGWISAQIKNHIIKYGNKNVRFVYNLQDIFPDSAVNAGLFRSNSVLWRIGRKIENETYRRADRIIVISGKCRENLIKKFVPIDKISLISNWIDISEVKHVNRSQNRIIEELGINQDKYLVVYAGNMGEVQGVEVILRAAKLLEYNKEIEFILFGAGSRFEDIKEEARNSINTRVFSLMGADRVSEVYSLGDVSLITCKEGTGTAGLPSKLWSIMACETPVIASFDTDSDLNLILQDSKSGLCVPPNDAIALADAIAAAYGNKWSVKTEKKAREYVRKNASKEICLKKYVNAILSVE